ncbi:31894_t:CDS:2 [Gigaspora margarita]|uniref:31894_t:CDS:1 n=1 Tax=Gigaspora margarita TaxID=4874 RepID=A0ABM8VXH0_GIGMA|nr:31894_t:CDS:2 [Gigaspora margarita]
MDLDFVASVYACMILEYERINEVVPSLYGIINDFKVSFILVNGKSESIFKGSYNIR